MDNLQLVTSKENGIWIAKMQFQVSDGNFVDIPQEKVESDSFSDLLIKIGEKCWIDKMNKND